MTAHNRFPWTADEEAHLATRKHEGARHKVIARELQRTPRAIDQHVARMKEYGKLAMHRREEMDLLARVEAEALQPERYPEERR